MPNVNKFSTNRSESVQPRNDHENPNTEAKTSSESTSPKQLDRVAQLVANGELPLPLDLPVEQLEYLVREVRRSRQRRLVQYLARAIAVDIHREREQKNRDKNHA